MLFFLLLIDFLGICLYNPVPKHALQYICYSQILTLKEKENAED